MFLKSNENLTVIFKFNIKRHIQSLKKILSLSERRNFFSEGKASKTMFHSLNFNKWAVLVISGGSEKDEQLRGIPLFIRDLGVLYWPMGWKLWAWSKTFGERVSLHVREPHSVGHLKEKLSFSKFSFNYRVCRKSIINLD